MIVNYEYGPGTKYDVGTRVSVQNASQKEDLGYGTISKFEDDSGMPVIKLDTGKELRGSECWWIPIEEALNTALSVIKKLSEIG